MDDVRGEWRLLLLILLEQGRIGLITEWVEIIRAKDDEDRSLSLYD